MVFNKRDNKTRTMDQTLLFSRAVSKYGSKWNDVKVSRLNLNGSSSSGGVGVKGGGIDGSVTFNARSLNVVESLQSTKRTILGVVEAYSKLEFGENEDEGLSENDKDAFEQKIDAILKEQQENIDSLKKEIPPKKSDANLHMATVIQYIYDMLQDCKKTSGELTMLRMRQMMASKKTLYVEEYTGINKQVDDWVAEAKVLEEKTYGIRNRKDKKNGAWSELDDEIDLMGEDIGALDEETVQTLTQEQRDLESKLDEEIEKVKEAEKTMNEISEMFAFFNQELVDQTRTIANIYDHVESSVDYVDKSTEQLEQVRGYNKSFRRNVIIFFSVATLLLLLLDAMD